MRLDVVEGPVFNGVVSSALKDLKSEVKIGCKWLVLYFANNP